MKHLTNQLNKIDIGSKEYIATSKKLRNLKGILNEHKQQLNEAAQSTSKFSNSTKNSAVVLGGFSSLLMNVSGVLSKFVSASQEYVESYASLDDAMTDVVKYTGMTRQEVEELNEAFAAMDTRTPVTELNRLAGEYYGICECTWSEYAGGGDECYGNAEDVFMKEAYERIESALNSLFFSSNSWRLLCVAETIK